MSILKQQMPDAYQRVAKMVGFCLYTKNQDAWWGLPVVMAARLTGEERAAIAFMALKSMERDKAVSTAEAALNSGAGMPIAPFVNYSDEAAFWAQYAPPEELYAYARATLAALPPTLRRSVLRQAEAT